MQRAARGLPLQRIKKKLAVVMPRITKVSYHVCVINEAYTSIRDATLEKIRDGVQDYRSNPKIGQPNAPFRLQHDQPHKILQSVVDGKLVYANRDETTGTV